MDQAMMCCMCGDEYQSFDSFIKALPCGHKFCKRCLTNSTSDQLCVLCLNDFTSDKESIQTDFGNLDKAGITHTEDNDSSSSLQESKEHLPMNCWCSMDTCKEELHEQFTDTSEIVNDMKSKLETEMDLLRTAHSKLDHEVNTHFEKLSQLITRRKQLLKKQLSHMVNEKLDLLEDSLDTVTFTEMCLDSLEKHTFNILENSDSRDNLAAISKRVKVEINELTEKVEEISITNNGIVFEQMEDKTKSIELMIQSSGRVRSHGVLPSVVKLTDSHIVFNEPSKILFIVRDFQGKAKDICFLKDLKVQIIDPMNENMFLKTEIMESLVSVVFTPIVFGQYSCFVSLFDNSFLSHKFNVKSEKSKSVHKGIFTTD